MALRWAWQGPLPGFGPLTVEGKNTGIEGIRFRENPQTFPKASNTPRVHEDHRQSYSRQSFGQITFIAPGRLHDDELNVELAPLGQEPADPGTGVGYMINLTLFTDGPVELPL
jgi:hypothetical protein